MEDRESRESWIAAGHARSSCPCEMKYIEAAKVNFPIYAGPQDMWVFINTYKDVKEAETILQICQSVGEHSIRVLNLGKTLVWAI